jgi:hypothetical protein
VSESRLQAKATNILHRNNAQEILQALATLEEHRAEFTTRWLWELVQNARDFPDDSRPMTIRISVSPAQITFAHNGRDFSEEEILSLIYHGSTKQSNPDQLGKFGTGFLSTHLLSKKVRVKGTLFDEENGRRGFEFDLDRSGADADQVGEAMQRSFRALEISLARSGVIPTEWTEFFYQADEASDWEELESDFPFDAIPYILIFDDKVTKIELRLPQHEAAFERAGSGELENGGRLTTIEGLESAAHFITHEANGITAAVPIVARPDGSFEILPPGAVPKFFKFLPLVNTSNIGLPAVFHSRLFSPTENRDGLNFVASGVQSDLNKRLLKKASNCFFALARNCSAAGFHELQGLLDVRAVPEYPPWLTDRQWYEDFQRAMIRSLSAIPLVKLSTGEIAAMSSVDLPFGDKTMTSKDVYRYGLQLFPTRIPDASIAEDCSAIAEEWTEILGENDALIQSCVLTPSRLIEKVKQTESLQGLGALLEFEQPETVDWLNSLFESVPEEHRRVSLDGLVPDQTPEGVFRSSDGLSRESEIDDELKDILEALGDPIRTRLIHSDMRGTGSMIKAAQQREPLVVSAKDLLKKGAPVSDNTPEFRSACLAMFQWLATNKCWVDLKDAVPVYTLDGDESELVGKTSGRAAVLLAPRGLWPAKARAYWDAFPNGSVLVDDYAPLLTDTLWREAAENQIVITRLLWSAEVALSDLEKFTRDLELESDGHSAVSSVRVGKMAFVGTEPFYDAVRNSRERAARFLEFVLEYAVDADDSWTRSLDVPCECGKSHQIIPCEWLAWIRDREWAPRRRGHERLTNASLALLTLHNPRLADAVTREQHSDFLNLVGINVLEQALLAANESQRPGLRRQLAQLAKLAMQHPDTVAQLMEDIAAHHEASKRWRENQKLGKIVEELIAARLKSRLLPHRIRVKIQFKGYDLGAYVDDNAVPDVGSVEVEAGSLVAKIEIKATRGKTVSLSNRQGEEASNDQPRFWLCVVPLDRDEEVDELTSERVEELARFISGIGDRLMPTREGIRDAVRTAEEDGFDLEHTDEIRYGIRSEIWAGEAVQLATFVAVLARSAKR